MEGSPPAELAGRLTALVEFLRAAVVERRSASSTAADAAVEREGADDVLYGIDRVSEESLLAWFRDHWPAGLPAELVAEGLAEEGPVPVGASPDRDPLFRIIVDPIDGTRGLMYDKRPAWVLAGIARREGPGVPDISALLAGAMAEIPPRKQEIADRYTAWWEPGRGWRLDGERRHLPSGESGPLEPAPSTATDLRHGFASFVSFFPEGRRELGAIEEDFLARQSGTLSSGKPLVFTDQYISTGGQFHEILAGRDRMVADLRPLVFARDPAYRDCLPCHPYDVAALPVLRAAGCPVTDPWGGELRLPLDTRTPVAWVGYANPALAARLGPHLRAALAARGYSPPTGGVPPPPS